MHIFNSLLECIWNAWYKIVKVIAIPSLVWAIIGTLLEIKELWILAGCGMIVMIGLCLYCACVVGWHLLCAMIEDDQKSIKGYM